LIFKMWAMPQSLNPGSEIVLVDNSTNLESQFKPRWFVHFASFKG